jgi:hypothetical protein
MKSWKLIPADSVPTPSAGHLEPSSDIIVPSALPSEVTSDDWCSTALITITTTRTVSVVTQIPFSLLTVTGIVELSSFMPSQPLPPTSATGIIQLSSWAAQPSSSAVTIIVPGNSATYIGESSVSPPRIPYPTASDKPTSTTTVGTTSYTSASGLPDFTAAAAAGAVKVLVGVAGVLGWAALVL